MIESNNNLKKMTVEELKSEMTRLQEGRTGVGFDKLYTHQCMEMLENELKARGAAC